MKWEKGWVRCLMMLVLMAAAPYLMLVAVERLNGNFLSDFLTPGEDIWENYVVYLLLYVAMFGLSGSVRISVMTVSPILLLFGIANMYVKEFKGSPLVPMDFSSIKTAGNVAVGYTYHVGYEIALGVCLTGMLMALASRLSMPKKGRPGRIALRLLSILVVGGFAYTFYFTDTVADFGLKPDFFNQTRGYKNHGAVLEFTLNTKYLKLMVPSGYDASKIEGIVDDSIEENGTPNILETALIRQGMDPEEAKDKTDVPTAVEQGKTPNVIVIMNESFSDLSVVGDIETNVPYMPYIDSIQDETIQGNAYVSTIGTGTSNTEYEFLTGNTMAFLPAGSNAYQLYVKEQQPSLVSTLMSQGFSANAFHPYFESSWNRPQVYEDMGFEDFISVEDLFGQELVDKYVNSGYSYNLYKRLLRQKYPGQQILLRRFVSDAYDFQQIEQMYEEKDPDQPMFLFNVTIQNHGAYTVEDYPAEVTVEDAPGVYPKAEQYLTLANKTDEAFRQLVEYFEQQTEPTIIVMFGDHQPSVEQEFLDMAYGVSEDGMTMEQYMDKYRVPYVVWANFPLEEEEQSGATTSLNFLSQYILEYTGVQSDSYFSFLDRLRQTLPTITFVGYLDQEGNAYSHLETNSFTSLIEDYQCVQYERLFGLEGEV